MIEFFQELNWVIVGQIILIDILLGGDNAIVIALACRHLPEELRFKGILWGTFGAIIVRIVLTVLTMIIVLIVLIVLIRILKWSNRFHFIYIGWFNNTYTDIIIAHCRIGHCGI